EAAFARERQTLQLEVERARTNNPTLNMVRRDLRQYIERFRSFAAELTKGQRKNPLDLSTIEHQASNFIKQHYPAYTHFADDFAILQCSTGGAVLDARSGIAQCEARIKRIEDLLDMLG